MPVSIHNVYFIQHYTHGSVEANVVTPAKSAVAPTVPNLLYICLAKSGNAAAVAVLTNVFAAIALAAIGLYAVTVNVNIEA